MDERAVRRLELLEAGEAEHDTAAVGLVPLCEALQDERIAELRGGLASLLDRRDRTGVRERDAGGLDERAGREVAFSGEDRARLGQVGHRTVSLRRGEHGQRMHRALDLSVDEDAVRAERVGRAGVRIERVDDERAPGFGE